MKPGSPFLTRLAGNPYPGIGYVELAGDEAKVLPGDPDYNRLDALLDRLEGMGVPVDRLFHSQPNDLAVTTESATGTPPGWAPPPTTIAVACDHVTYFSSDDGQAALAAALGQP